MYTYEKRFLKYEKNNYNIKIYNLILKYIILKYVKYVKSKVGRQNVLHILHI